MGQSASAAISRRDEGEPNELVVESRQHHSGDKRLREGSFPTNKLDKHVRMTSYYLDKSHGELNNNFGVFGANPKGRYSAIEEEEKEEKEQRKRKMSEMKKVAALEQELISKEEEIRALREAISKMPEFAK